MRANMRRDSFGCESSNRFALEPIQSLELTHRRDEHKLVIAGAEKI